MMYPPPNMPSSPYLPAPVTSEEGPLPEAMHGIWPGRYTKVTGIVLIVMVLVAILAAVVGPLLTSRASSGSAPGNWSKTYDSNLRDASDWKGDSGCYRGPNGLDVTASSNSSDLCVFTPSTTADLVSQGFQLNLALAPESRLQLPLSPLIQVTDSGGDGFSVQFDDTGDFAICPDTSSDCSACLPGTIGGCSDALDSDSTDAWHTDSYVANTLGIRYQIAANGGGTLTVIVNGQEIASGPLSTNLTSGFAIAIGSSDTGSGDGGEALYTVATLYTASS
ncbi:MAG: hypothetical protein ACLQUY_03135 [Ktedonobacterales bacterium]